MFFVNERWLGGLLTNFATIQRSLGRLRDLETMATDGRYDTLSKKEIARNEKERRKLQKNLEGIRGMARLPDAVFVVDTRKEKIAVDEARKLKIPVLGIVDTNCDPDEVDFVIPGNDDALRAIRLFASRIADAVIAGRGMKESADVEADARRRPTTTRPAGAQPRPATPPARSGAGVGVAGSRRSRAGLDGSAQFSRSVIGGLLNRRRRRSTIHRFTNCRAHFTNSPTHHSHRDHHGDQCSTT